MFKQCTSKFSINCILVFSCVRTSFFSVFLLDSVNLSWCILSFYYLLILLNSSISRSWNLMLPSKRKKKPPQQQLMINNRLFTSVLYQSSGKLELLLFRPVTIVYSLVKHGPVVLWHFSSRDSLRTASSVCGLVQNSESKRAAWELANFFFYYKMNNYWCLVWTKTRHLLKKEGKWLSCQLTPLQTLQSGTLLTC